MCYGQDGTDSAGDHLAAPPRRAADRSLHAAVPLLVPRRSGIRRAADLRRDLFVQGGGPLSTEGIRSAALYVLARSSPYAEIDGVDLWPKSRDARLYPGPWPVLAHPPCGHWSRSVAPRTHDTPEHDRDLAPLAVGQVRRWGGIVEHPRRSKLWDRADLALPRPASYGAAPMLAPRDDFGGFSVEVRQCDWGDKRRKSTWLYFCHVDPARVVLPEPRSPAPSPDHIPPRRRRDGKGLYARCWSDAMGSQERKRTVPKLAHWLVDLAATAEPAG